MKSQTTPEPPTWERFDAIDTLLRTLQDGARAKEDETLATFCEDTRASLARLKLAQPPLEHNCWNCAIPHCRYLTDGKTVFCYGHPAVEDHAVETNDAEHNVCSNWRGKAKRLGCCRYSHRCELNHDGRCSLKTWCKYQGGTPR